MWPVKCFTNTLSKPLKAMFAAVKTGLQKYHHTSFSGIGVNQISILKISKDSLDALSTRSQYVCSNMNIFDFSTLCTTIPHTQLKYRIKELIQRCFLKKNKEQRYDYHVASWKAIQSIIIHISRTRSFKCWICFINNIFVLFGGWVFQQKIGIPLDTNCSPLLADLPQGLLMKKR